MTKDYYIEWWEKNPTDPEMPVGFRRKITDSNGQTHRFEILAAIECHNIIVQERNEWTGGPYKASFHVHRVDSINHATCKYMVMEETHANA